MKNNDLSFTNLLPPLMTRMVTDQFQYADTGEPEGAERWPNFAACEQTIAPERTRRTLPRLRLPRLARDRTASRLPASRDPA